MILITNLIFSPLEQFEIFYFSSNWFFDTVDFTNEDVTLILILLIFILFLWWISIKNKKAGLLLIPSSISQRFLEFIYTSITSLIVDNIGIEKGQKFFPLIYSLFLYIFLMNIQGLFPYNFTVTSHIVCTFALSFSLFIGINLYCIYLHGIKFFSLFLPAGTSFFLALLLVPIEIVSFVFKPISLAIRLFANMMAGHALIKVIVGFAWSLLSCTNLTLYFFHYFPFLVLIPLYCLELAVAFIQSLIFSTLICIYLNDAINLH